MMWGGHAKKSLCPFVVVVDVYFSSIAGNKPSEETTAEEDKNINDNIEFDEASSSRGAASNHGNNDADEVVVEAKRRRKSPPVQIRQQQLDTHEDNNLFSPSSVVSAACEDAVKSAVRGLSLKSHVDLEQRGRDDEPVSPPRKEESPADVSASVQAALAALQAGQISLNQVRTVCN
jgi:hypothetical protein